MALSRPEFGFESRSSGEPAYHAPKRVVTYPTLLVELVFLTPAEGGRQSPSVFWKAPTAHYRPHLVVQDRCVRHARTTPEANINDEDYLGVSFVGGPERVDFGEPVRGVLRLDYFPEVNYDALREGATFTVREGARIVAHGIVLERRSAS